jgi:hypothetical protein
MYSLVVSAVSAVMGFSVLVAPVQAREGRTTAVQWRPATLRQSRSWIAF